MYPGPESLLGRRRVPPIRDSKFEQCLKGYDALDDVSKLRGTSCI